MKMFGCMMVYKPSPNLQGRRGLVFYISPKRAAG